MSICKPGSRDRLSNLAQFFMGKNSSLVDTGTSWQFWQKNGHILLVNCLQEACPGTVVNVTDCHGMTSAVYCESKASNQTKYKNNFPHMA